MVTLLLPQTWPDTSIVQRPVPMLAHVGSCYFHHLVVVSVRARPRVDSFALFQCKACRMRMEGRLWVRSARHFPEYRASARSNTCAHALDQGTLSPSLSPDPVWRLQASESCLGAQRVGSCDTSIAFPTSAVTSGDCVISICCGILWPLPRAAPAAPSPP